MLSVGLLGLPNVGKSTLFNALTAAGAEVSNYPFTTIDSNLGRVPVPDPRLAALEAAVEPAESTPCHVQFIDIAGLVEGASRGEGLGNRFLGAIRQVDAVVHVLRGFADPGVAHVFETVDPVRDAGIVETELLLADLEVLERALEKRRRLWKADPRAHAEEEARLEGWLERLRRGEPLRGEGAEPAARGELKALGLLTGKPLLYVLNVDEAAVTGGAQGAGRQDAGSGAPDVTELESAPGAPPVLRLCARLEAELRELEPAERREFQRELGLETSGLDRLANAALELLGLIRFYTLAHGKLRAWEIERGATAPQAAGRIHGDMERGFIRAQVAAWEEVVEHCGLHQLQPLGRLRTEGRDYRIRDGDVVEFLFSP